VSRRTLRLSDADRRHLISGAAALGVVLDREVVLQLTRFAELLDLWAPKMNLLSCGSAREIVERHFLDSLAVAPMLPESGLIVDLGTGAGFPGVPLAVLRSTQPWALVESRRRRSTFLREVRRTLGLHHVEIVEGRAESPTAELAGRASAVVTRAVWSDSSLLEIAPRWLEPNGRLFWMRSRALPDGIGLSGMHRDDLVRYQIGGDRVRLVEILAKLNA
jgi:16S rRNA (guanine527-N7)-methyltransferase